MTATLAAEITLNKKAWDETTTRLIARTQPEVGIEALKTAFETGHITPYELLVKGQSVGEILVRTETLWNGQKELVVLYGAAVERINISFTSLVVPFVEQLAREAGIKSVRVHSERRGLDAILQENGCRFIGSAFRKDIL